MKTTTIFNMTVLFLIVLSVVSCKGNKGGLDNKESDMVMVAKDSIPFVLKQHPDWRSVVHREAFVQRIQWGYPSRALCKACRETLWREDYQTGWRLQLFWQRQPFFLQWTKHSDFILAERQEARNHILCQYGQERTCPCTSHSNGRILWNAEGTLRTQADKRPNQEDGNPDHLLRHPHG